ncbi:32332_t:CDS:10, partial [Gigaspora margarita]
MSRLQEAKVAIEQSALQYLEKITQDPTDNKAYLAFENILDEYLSNPAFYSEQEQIELLNCIKDVTIPLKDEEQKAGLPFLSSYESTSLIVLEIVDVMAQLNVRDIHVVLFERFSLLDWENSENFVSEFTGLVKILRIAETLQYIVRAWQTLKTLKDKNLDLVTECLIGFTEFAVQTINLDSKDLKLSITPNDIPDQEFFLINYLIVQSFEEFVRSFRMPMSSIYYETFHPKFNVPWKQKQKDSIRLIDQQRLSKLIRAAIKSHISSNQLVNYIIQANKKNTDSKDHLEDDDQEVTPEYIDSVFENNKEISKPKFDTSEFPISPGGVISYLASAIYYKSMALEGSNTLKDVFSESPEYMFREIIPVVSIVFIKHSQENEIIDKVLLVLLYLAERNEESTITMQHLTASLSKDEITLGSLFTMISSFASTSSEEILRFNAHQLLSRIIALCTDDTRMFLLQQLLTNSPFEQMKSAAIGILKEIVAQRLNQAYGKKHDNELSKSVFASPYLIEGFFPIIFRLKSIIPAEAISTEDQETEFEEKHSFIMHGINFYLFLLTRDEQNKTGVWNSNQLKQTKDEYLVPVTTKCKDLMSKYEKHLKELNQPCLDKSDENFDANTKTELAQEQE